MEAGREMDKLIAEKVMGWHKGLCSECNNRPWLPDSIPCQYWHTQDGNDTKNPISDIWSGGMSDSLNEKAWSPSTDIAAAWEVLLEMNRSGWLLKIISDFDIMRNKVVYRCSFLKVGEREVLCDFNGLETTPHAICLAALRAKGVEI